jgi:hypothetical protein
MAVLQSTYTDVIRPGVPGMIVNSETYNKISRTADGAVGFGLPVLRSPVSPNHNCILATQETFQAAGAAVAGNTGNGTITAAPAIVGAPKEGVYMITFIAAAANSGTFQVEDPDGIIIDIGTVGVAWAKVPAAFTIADGATDFVVGDQFTVTVTPTALTDDLDFLGLSVRDITLGAAVDAYAQYDSVAIMDMGVMWVTAGATVTAGMLAYWNPATSRYTNDATHYPVPKARFDTGGANGDTVRLALRLPGRNQGIAS